MTKNNRSGSMRFVRIVLVLLFLGNVCPAGPAEDASYRKDIDNWRQERVANLKKEDGWLTLVGLFWLKEGKNTLGSDRSADVILPASKAPKKAGFVFLEKEKIRFEVVKGVDIRNEGKPVESLELQTDSSGKPTILTLNSLSFFVIQRKDRYAIRVKDKENRDRQRFTGLQYFPVDPKWRLEARFEAHNSPKKIPILNIVGILEDTPSPGTVVFQIQGKDYRIDALQDGDSKELFLIFADATSGKETYGAGRYLYADAPGADGKVIVDFNKAYNPPCAFTSFATCPLPPRQNRLALRIDAGEKNYSGHGSH